MSGYGTVVPSGGFGLCLIRGDGSSQTMEAPSRWPTIVPTLGDIRAYGLPHFGLPAEVNAWRRANRPNLWRGVRKIMAARALKIPHLYGQLWLTVYRGDGEIVDLGLASLRLVTTAGVRFICDDLNAGGTDVSTMKYHGFGTGTGAEAVGDTALGTELTTEYVTNSTRPTGSQASATVSTNATYTTVATLAPDSGGTLAITEHGVFSATSAGTLLDRTVFSAVNLVASSDSLAATYVFTASSGG